MSKQAESQPAQQEDASRLLHDFFYRAIQFQFTRRAAQPEIRKAEARNGMADFLRQHPRERQRLLFDGRGKKRTGAEIKRLIEAEVAVDVRKHTPICLQQFQEQEKAWREFLTLHPEFQERARVVEALPVDAESEAVKNIVFPTDGSGGAREVTLDDYTDEALTNFAERVYLNRPRWRQWRQVPPRQRRRSRVKTVEHIGAAIEWRANSRREHLERFEAALKKDRRVVLQQLRHCRLTVDEWRATSALPREMFQHWRALDARDELLIELAGTGVDLWDLCAVLVDPKDMKKAQRGIWEGYKEGAKKQKRLNLDAKKMSSKRKAAFEKLLRAKYGPARDGREMETSRLGLRGRKDRRSWRLRDPWLLRMAVDVYRALEKSKLPRRELGAYTAEIIKRHFAANSVRPPSGLDAKVVRDQIRYQRRR